MRRGAAQVVFGCAAVLLSYPCDDLSEDLDAVSDALARIPEGRARSDLVETVSWLGGLTPLRAAAIYVETFDLERRRTLHLTHYRHGDTRERGLALAALVDAYREAGLRLRPGELPDFLPALLELAATDPVGASILKEHRAALEALRLALEESGSGYSGAIRAVADVLGPFARSERVVLRRYRDQGPPSEQVGREPFVPPEVLRGGVTSR